jgi:hypothetical protein
MKESLSYPNLTSGVAAPRFPGHYAFRDKRHPIDFEAILAEVDWEQPSILVIWLNFAGLCVQPHYACYQLG